MGVMAYIVADDLEKHKSTIGRLYRKIETVVSWNTNLLRGGRIGGNNMVVEIDECLLVRRKYRRGRVLRHQKWIVVVRRDTSKYS